MAEELKVAEKQYGKKLPAEFAYTKNYLDLMQKSGVNF